jgi:glycosyltransferase involved in cell wall biosynthesis
MKTSRLLALVQKAPNISPGQRFRLEQWAPYLARDHGIEIEFDAFESPALSRIIYQPGRTARKIQLVLADSMRRWGVRRRIDGYDAVVIYREAMLVGGAWLESALAARGVTVILDFDDAIWTSSGAGRSSVANLVRMPWKVSRICRLASAVTVGNEYLAAYARRYNDNVFIVRTSIEASRYPQFPMPSDSAPFTVVWTGSHSTLPYLESIRGALVELGARVRTRLRVICDVPPAGRFDGVELEFVRWTAAREVEDLAPGHVGIMPLPDNEFTRGKCGLKAIQYMAIGRPAVVSPVGINREIVRDGENGLWATTQREWTAQLERLARDAALRARLGSAARRTAVEGYTAQTSAAAFANAVRRVTASSAACSA